MALKLFLVGMPKAGTSTLQTALSRSGLKSAHWRAKDIGFVGPIMYRNFFSKRDPLLEFAGYDAVTQADVAINGANYWPQMDFCMLESVRQHHPDCCFVLNYRDPLAVARSMVKWTDLADRLCRLDIPGLPRGYGRNEGELARWIEGHYRTIRRYFDGDPAFLEYDISDSGAPKLIGDRLGVEITWWGRANKTDGNNPVLRQWRGRGVDSGSG